VAKIQQAPSAPNTVYACGPTPSGSSSGLGFGLSQDGGKTWTTWATSIPASACLAMSVSPSAPQAVAVYSASCRAECGQGEFYMDYSLDSGKHWTHVYTSGNSVTEAPFAWVGTTFFANGAPSGTPSSATQNLALSKNGGSFSWTSLSVGVGQLFSTATTLYVVTTAETPAVYSTTNLGVSWSKVTPTYQGNAINATTLVPGGPRLGYDDRSIDGTNVYPMVRSSDGGASWQALQSVPAGFQANTDAVETPDGTVYVTFVGTTSFQAGIFKLMPGASQWTLVAPLVPGTLFLNAVIWDANGHPVSVWGLQGTPAYTSIPWTHAA